MKLKRYVNGAWVVVDKELKQLTTATDSASSPITIIAPLAESFDNYRVYGATSGVGDETENLVTEIIQNASIGSTGRLVTSNLYNASIAPITAGTTYTLLRDYDTSSLYYAFFTELPAIGSVSYNGGREDARQLSVTITAPITGYVVLLNPNGESTVAEGNTAIPYGYKIPLTIAGKNEFDKTATNPNKGYVDGRYLIGGDTTLENAAWAVSEYIAVRPGTEYIWQWRERRSSVANPRLAIYDSTYTTIDTIKYGNYAPNANHIPFTTGATAAFVRLSYEKSSIDEATLYKTSTTPVYIGSSKLYEDEYLDYREQKIYKDVSGTLAPTDPPVPFPSVQHYEGENMISVGTTVAPDKLELTYQGWRVAANPEPKSYHNGQWMTEYRRVEYLKSTGTQAITTNIVPLSTTRTELDIKFGSDIKGSSASGYERGIFGVSEVDGSNNVKAQYLVNALKGSPNSLIFYNKFTWRSGISANYLNDPGNFDTADNAKQTVAMQGGVGSWGSTSIDFTSEMLNWPELTIPLVVFGVYNAAGGGLLPFKVKELSVYEMRTYDNNTLTHNLIPVERQIDGVLGLYDTITDTFYTNAGTGTFVKGGYI